MIAMHVALRYGAPGLKLEAFPLYFALTAGAPPLLWDLVKDLLRREIGSDVLAGLSIIAAILLGEPLAGSIVVLMFAGGHALEEYAVANASSVLGALAARMPSIAHRRKGSVLSDVTVNDIVPGDTIVVFPHEICPVDGLVAEGHSRMDEAYLTGEPFQIDKAPGSAVISGAINGDSALTVSVTKRAIDSRYSKITQVMQAAERERPPLRRVGDRLGALYAPAALAVAATAWMISGDPVRFLAVLVVATPCPLLIGIPIAFIGSVSLCARRGIIVKNPSAFEELDECRVAIFDKTGTLTYGEPELAEMGTAPGFSEEEVLGLAAGLERYSKHPLAAAVVGTARRRGAIAHEASEIREVPGEGLSGTVSGRKVRIMGRGAFTKERIEGAAHLPPAGGGMECIVIVDGTYAALFRFRDTPRADGLSFIRHLGPQHRLGRTILISGDRESEVRYLAEKVGITEVYAQKSPEEKLVIVRSETAKAKTLFMGDGINDAPALMAATVGVAMGQKSDVTSEAADIVVMDTTLTKVDELMHISRRMRTIALQSAVGGISLSLIGIGFAAAGHLTPVLGAIAQEGIDLLAILNALRAAFPPKELSDF
jgi:heavy metal translocating P-type ATPase